MPSRRFVIAAVGCVLLPACGPAPAPDAPPPALHPVTTLEADIAEMVPALLDKYRVPGASVAVLVDRDIVIARGFGLLRAGEDARPVSEHSVFQAASLS